ncbi:MAG: SIS domain-containing protein, partial [Bacteroidota bacterium]|nr:SIS domain-containing protein [Bacteroidota bacterium]
MLEDIKKIVSASIAVKQKLLSEETLLKTVALVVDEMVKAFKAGHRIYFAGNGGSAADAQHLAAEFSGRFY